jgi:hypothetical protein
VQPVDLPFQSEQFAEAWGEWVEHNRAKRKPLPPTTIKFQLRRLAKWGESRSMDAIEYSIRQNYQGIFEETIKGSTTKPANRHAGLNTMEITGNEF